MKSSSGALRPSRCGTLEAPRHVAAGPAYCTNGVYTEIIVRHLATLYTNMTVGN